MPQCTYEDLRDDMKIIAVTFHSNGFKCRAYNRGTQFNVMDASGVLQTFYPTTGTVVFHLSNEVCDRGKVKTFKHKTIRWFMDHLRNPETIRKLIMEETLNEES